MSTLLVAVHEVLFNVLVAILLYCASAISIPSLYVAEVAPEMSDQLGVARFVFICHW